MPQIIVTADYPAEDGEPPIMFRERVSVSDFESQHFTAQLAERLGWAVGDAAELERRSAHTAERRRIAHRMAETAGTEETPEPAGTAEAAETAETAGAAEPEAAEPEFAGVSAGPARRVS